MGGREPIERDDEHLMQGIHNENEALIMKGGMHWGMHFSYFRSE